MSKLAVVRSADTVDQTGLVLFRSRTRRTALRIAVVAILSSAVASVSVQRLIDQSLATEIPLPPARAHRLDTLFWDTTPVTITLAAEWQKVSMTVPAYVLESSSWYWQRMHFDDWDHVPDGLRENALRRMWRRYADVVASPHQWDRMSTDDWDAVPQPIRAMAFTQMIRYWSGFYRVGSAFNLPRGTVTNTMGAITMVESWFEHRAVFTNRAGNRDVGLGQLSDWTRARLSSLLETGRVDFAPPDESGYYDPWQATRMIALWFDLMLEEQHGDVDAAIRAYHRGSPLARAGEGEEYLANVLSKRRTFMRGQSRSPAWNFLWDRARQYRRGDGGSVGPL